jgi:hypothetical protein
MYGRLEHVRLDVYIYDVGVAAKHQMILFGV